LEVLCGIVKEENYRDAYEMIRGLRAAKGIEFYIRNFVFEVRHPDRKFPGANFEIGDSEMIKPRRRAFFRRVPVSEPHLPDSPESWLKD
jgi:hypothetical protein